MKKRSSRAGRSSRLSRFFAWIVLAGAIWAAALYPGRARLSAFYEKMSVLEDETELLKRENEALREEIQALREDPFFMEKRAREMGLTKEGEVIFSIRFTEESESCGAEGKD